MDLHEIWQENKRWILGVAAGAIVFWIGLGFIRGTYDVSGTRRQVGAMRSKVQGKDLYDSEALTAAEDERARLQARFAALREAVVFEVADWYRLEGKADPDLHYPIAANRLQRGIRRRAEMLNVLLEDGAVQVPTPDDVPAIERALLGMNVLDEVAKRLLDAHQTVLRTEPDNLGLVSIEELKLPGSRRRGRLSRPQRNRHRRRSDVNEGIRTVPAEVKFHADTPTLAVFLEACRAEEPRLILESFKSRPGANPTDPVEVTAKFAALLLQQN